MQSASSHAPRHETGPPTWPAWVKHRVTKSTTGVVSGVVVDTGVVSGVEVDTGVVSGVEVDTGVVSGVEVDTGVVSGVEVDTGVVSSVGWITASPRSPARCLEKPLSASSGKQRP